MNYKGDGLEWEMHSISYYHNLLEPNQTLHFTQCVNDTGKSCAPICAPNCKITRTSSAYNTIMATGNDTAVIVYDHLPPPCMGTCAGLGWSMQIRVSEGGVQPSPPPPSPSPPPPPPSPLPPSPPPSPVTDLYRCVNNTCVHIGSSGGTGIDLATCKKICGPGRVWPRIKSDDDESDLAATVQQMSSELRALQLIVAVLLCCCIALVFASAPKPAMNPGSAGVEPQHSRVLPLASRLCVADKCFLNVESFGAVGDDKKDCTTSIQSALNAMKDGDVLFFPPGTYLTTSTINIGGSGGTLVGSAAAPKLLTGITVCGTADSIIHHNPGVQGKGFGHRVLDVHGPRCVLRDLSFVNRESYPHTGAGANINVQMSAEFVELAGLFFDVTGQNPIVICCRGARVHDCVVKSSPEHGVYLSGAAYDLQQPSDTRIENNHFENIAKNGAKNDVLLQLCQLCASLRRSSSFHLRKLHCRVLLKNRDVLRRRAGPERKRFRVQSSRHNYLRERLPQRQRWCVYQRVVRRPGPQDANHWQATTGRDQWQHIRSDGAC